MEHTHRDRRGFTLIELLIVVIIIAILMAIALPAFLSQREKAKDASVKEGIHSLQMGIESYAAEHDDVYPASGDLGVLRTTYVDAWPTDAFAGGEMSYSLTAAPGSYSYVSTGSAYVLTGWLSDGSFQVPASTDPLLVSFSGQTSHLVKLLLDFYAVHHRWPRSWSPYNFTDLGLDPAAYAAAINGVKYSAGGSTVVARPAPGYVMTATGVNGRKFVMTSNLNWNFVYDATTGKWYYHTISPANQIDFSTMQVTQQ